MSKAMCLMRTPRETLEQRRARHAWKCAETARAHLKDKYDDYAKLAKSLPALIMNSGLMQVVAFLYEKSLDKKTRKPREDDPHHWIGQHLRMWLHERFDGIAEDFHGFMADLMRSTSPRFQELTAEAFAWLKWLRQMAAARQGG